MRSTLPGEDMGVMGASELYPLVQDQGPAEPVPSEDSLVHRCLLTVSSPGGGAGSFLGSLSYVH